MRKDKAKFVDGKARASGSRMEKNASHDGMKWAGWMDHPPAIHPSIWRPVRASVGLPAG